MLSATLTFFACVFLVLYTYAFYPVCIWLLSRCFPSQLSLSGPRPSGVSVVFAARHENGRIAQRAHEFSQQLTRAGIDGEVIVVLDGPEPDQPSIEDLEEIPRVVAIRMSSRRGKAAAISAGARLAKHEILVFADVRQQWQDDAIDRLLENFRDPQVGAVSGDLVLHATKGITSGVGVYWRFEKWLRITESAFDSSVGVTGAICAVRSSLFHGVPDGTILDDVHWPLRVVMQGYRVIHDVTAIAVDRLPENARGEFRRKTRTLCGNFQLVSLLPETLLPWKNRLSWQFVSHKLMRLTVPWALILAYFSSAFIQYDRHYVLFCVQTIAYIIVSLLICSGIASKYRVVAAAASFALLNAAAWYAFWVWISGNAHKSWIAIRYDDKSPSP